MKRHSLDIFAGSFPAVHTLKLKPNKVGMAQSVCFSSSSNSTLFQLVCLVESSFHSAEVYDDVTEAFIAHVELTSDGSAGGHCPPAANWNRMDTLSGRTKTARETLLVVPLLFAQHYQDLPGGDPHTDTLLTYVLSFIFLLLRTLLQLVLFLVLESSPSILLLPV